ncbi:hypothetical protein GPECTOR_48g414 [Gonium pectorale]|uniref:SRCR domain-containing protein n=1 Tax=Gonium pectorale TaxID=33097 RepID=A0A150G815_GONPE|nr:hypothetical protein GPECTOR_48g414 [Gonium pectorale]|eukprot:KXZ45982.1 hypothetical protein GPECTOR_48g414 [Gonium pectorale]
MSNNCTSAGWGVHNCDHGEDVGLRCRGLRLRLVGGNTPTSGRVEVFHAGVWGGIGNDFNGAAVVGGREALVICRALGYGGGTFYPMGGESGARVWMLWIKCPADRNGSVVATPEDCNFSGWVPEYDYYRWTNFFGVNCTGSNRVQE